MNTIQQKMLEYTKREKERKLIHQIRLAKEELRKKDYIGRKIAEALLYNNETKLAEYKEIYSTDIANADILRQKINEWEAELEALKLK